jgi:preprotein translocase subunit SecF
VIPPFSHIGPISKDLRTQLMKNSIVGDTYDELVDSESAYEKLSARLQENAAQKEEEQAQKAQEKEEKSEAKRGDSATDALLKSAARAIGSQVGREIIRGILGSLFKK